MAGDGNRGALEREMGVTHRDLLRLLPAALGERPYTITDARVEVCVGGGRVTITYGAERERRIGLLRLPVTPVTIAWEEVDPAAFARFLAHFDRSYQRGGG